MKIKTRKMTNVERAIVLALTDPIIRDLFFDGDFRGNTIREGKQNFMHELTSRATVLDFIATTRGGEHGTK
jgi:hypothetical protein